MDYEEDYEDEELNDIDLENLNEEYHPDEDASDDGFINIPENDDEDGENE